MSGKNSIVATYGSNSSVDLNEALPRLAKALQDVLEDSQVHVINSDKLSVRFDGRPNWKVDVSRHQFVERKSSSAPIEQFQMVETSVDVKPLCIAGLSLAELQRLAARENFGLRGVTVIPVVATASEKGRSGLRVRAAFVAQTGATSDEAENLAIDIVTVLNFARTLEDRLTSHTVSGEFSFELYSARFENPLYARPVRFLTAREKVFEGSDDRVFAEVVKSIQARSIHKVQVSSERTATLTWSATLTSTPIQIQARIPSDIPMFVVQASVAELSKLEPQSRWDLVERLNAMCDVGHFEMNPNDFTLSFTAWKHLTNDLRAFSFDHAIASVHHALQLATENLSALVSAEIIEFPSRSAAPMKNAA